MPVVSTGLTLAGAKAEFLQRFQATKTVWQDLTTRIPSTNSEEKYRFLGQAPQMRKWGTGRKAVGLHPESFDIVNQKYESTIEVDRDEISDDQVGAIQIRIGELASRAATHKDRLIADLLKNGATAGFVAYDGKPFFAADHESGKSGTQDNTLAPAAVVATDPTVQEVKTALKSAVARLMSFVDDQGEPLNMMATGLVVIPPPSMYFTVLEALSATLIDSTSNVLAGAARVVPFAHLTAADTFYLLKADVAVRPFIFQDREDIEFNALERDTDRGFMNEVYTYGVRARYAIQYGRWEHAMKVTFA